MRRRKNNRALAGSAGRRSPLRRRSTRAAAELEGARELRFHGVIRRLEREHGLGAAEEDIRARGPHGALRTVDRTVLEPHPRLPDHAEGAFRTDAEPIRARGRRRV